VGKLYNRIRKGSMDTKSYYKKTGIIMANQQILFPEKTNPKFLCEN
jgi:hypothetical protein